VSTRPLTREEAQAIIEDSGWLGPVVPLARTVVALYDQLDARRATGSAVAAPLAELRRFLQGYPAMRGLDPEIIYTIHVSDEPCSLTVSGLTALADEITWAREADRVIQSVMTDEGKRERTIEAQQACIARLRDGWEPNFRLAGLATLRWHSPGRGGRTEMMTADEQSVMADG
jgi:hypothetical protein